MYRVGRHSLSPAHMDRLCDSPAPETTITREIASTCYSSIMTIHKSVTAALNFDQHHPPTLSNDETEGKWWVWRVSQCDTTVYGTEKSGWIFTCKNAWGSGVRVWIHLLGRCCLLHCKSWLGFQPGSGAICMSYII